MMGYFEFLPVENNLLSLKIAEKFHWQHHFEDLEEVETHRLHLVSTIQYPHTLKNNMYHSNERVPPPFTHTDSNPALSHFLVYFVDQIHALFVTLELIWLLFLNILFFNFVLKLAAVVLTFLLKEHCSKWPGSFFFTSASHDW